MSSPYINVFLFLVWFLVSCSCNSHIMDGFVQELEDGNGAAIHNESVRLQLNKLTTLLPSMNTIGISIYVKQDNYTSCQIYFPDDLPSFQDIGNYTDYIHQLGMKVLLKVGVEIGNSDIYSYINPSDPSCWFQSYNEILLSVGKFGELYHIEYFSIGLELTN